MPLKFCSVQPAGIGDVGSPGVGSGVGGSGGSGVVVSDTGTMVTVRVKLPVVPAAYVVASMV